MTLFDRYTRMDATALPLPAPESDLALLAKILALATSNMTSISALITQLSIELGHSPDPHLQRVGQKVLGDITELANDLDRQWQMIAALSHHFPPLAHAPAEAPELVTEIHI